MNLAGPSPRVGARLVGGLRVSLRLQRCFGPFATGHYTKTATARCKGNGRQCVMAAIPLGNDPSCLATRRIALRAAAVTATGAALTMMLAGAAIPASAAQTTGQARGECSAPSVLGSVSCVYLNPTDNYVLRVPAGVTELHIEARGAGGGSGGTIDSVRHAPEGGLGGLVSGDFPVSGGDVLRVLVGGRGSDGEGMRPGIGGLNGGGVGGAGALGGGGGGGASSVRLNGKDIASRILVAGGGGGAGGAMASTAVASARGGAGGGEHGGNGSGDVVGKGGIGATGPSGGAGLRRPTGLDGHSGYDENWGGGGGEGGYGASDKFKLKRSGTWASYPVGAGGGGGGYAGGSGGAAGPMVGGGGGGGSGMVATSALAPSVARLGSAELLNGGTGRAEDGQVIITYQLPTSDRQDRSESLIAPVWTSGATSNGREDV